MLEINKREGHAQRHGSDVRLVVEVDGKPVGCLDVDMERLWPLINHRKHDGLELEWLDRARFDSVVRAAVIKRLLTRLEQQLYRTLGDEIVKAQLEVESFTLRADAVAQALGRTKTDIERLVADSGRTLPDFYNFFWEYLLDDRDTADIRKQWKAARTAPQ